MYNDEIRWYIFFEIEKTGKRNIMAKEVMSNVTVLVGGNGAGKTTLMRCLGNIRCTGEEHRSGDDYKKFEVVKNNPSLLLSNSIYVKML